eukprot:4965077-Pyramimonas_sp.AAC.1
MQCGCDMVRIWMRAWIGMRLRQQAQMRMPDMKMHANANEHAPTSWQPTSASAEWCVVPARVSTRSGSTAQCSAR